MTSSSTSQTADLAIRAGGLALDRDGKLVRVLTIRTEDGVPFAWVSYVHEADEAARLEQSPGGYIAHGVWEHSLHDRETTSYRYPTDETGAHLRAWDGGILQERVTGHDVGLRPAPLCLTPCAFVAPEAA